MPSKKEKFDFKKQHKIGLEGEDLFLTFYPECKREDGYVADFSLKDKTIELKTDTYPMEKTENFFMEYYSDKSKQKMGGPWRAFNDSIDFFIYYFIKDNVLFWFDTVKLVEFLNEHIKGLKYKSVRNRAWISTGYAIKRDDLKHLFLKVDKFEESDPF